jgi:hypothetical protein
MKHLFWLLLFSFHFASAQKLKKADKLALSNLEKSITYLANDQLEGRRTGTPGEKLAYEYISKEFEKAGLAPKGENETWLQEFEVNDGNELNPTSHLIINGNDLIINQDYFPFSFSVLSLQQEKHAVYLKKKNKNKNKKRYLRGDLHR